jgi:hypothetical protein
MFCMRAAGKVNTQRFREVDYIDKITSNVVKKGTMQEMVQTEDVLFSRDELKEKLACGTVVIGRRGISKKEEFLFESTSNKIIHTAKDCAVWVIE